MKRRRKKIGRLRMMSYGMFVWLMMFPIFVFFILSPSCSIFKEPTPEKYMQSAKKYADKNDYKKARRDYTRAIEGNVLLFAAYWERALVEIKMDSLEPAIDDLGMYVESMRGKTGDADKRLLEMALMQRADIMFKRGYNSDACQDWSDACDLNLSNAPCQQLRLKCK